tara:strand:- start:204 stop:623 length:420 start_codon:yes stop_codon:yes gene_type:complete
MKKILIVNANYYKNISDNLIVGAKSTLIKNSVRLKIINVPGVFEIPIIIKKNINKFDGFLALGCVIKGETPHFELICKSTFDAIMKLMVDHQKPIGNGIITSLNMSQAIKRSSKKSNSSKPNKGFEAANAVIAILANES